MADIHPLKNISIKVIVSQISLNSFQSGIIIFDIYSNVHKVALIIEKVGQRPHVFLLLQLDLFILAHCILHLP